MKDFKNPRILLAVYDAPWIQTHVISAFNTLAAEVDIVNLRGLVAGHGDFASSAALAKSGSAKYDLVFIVEGKDENIAARDLQSFRASGAIVVNYLVDTPQDWWRSIVTSNNVDFVLSAQFENMKRLKTCENSVHMFPFAISDAYFHNIVPATKAEYVTQNSDRLIFLGSAHSRWRWKFVHDLGNAVQSLAVVGGGWTDNNAVPSIPSQNGRPGAVTRILNRLRTVSKNPIYTQFYRATHGELASLLGGALNAILPERREVPKGVKSLGFLDETELYTTITSSRAIVSTSVHGSGYLVGRMRKQFKLRDIELSVFGVPHLINQTPESDQFLKRLAFVYSDLNSLMDNIYEIENDLESSYDRAQALREHIGNNHLWSHRFEQLSRIIGIHLS